MPQESVAACTQRGMPPPGSCWASLTSDCRLVSVSETPQGRVAKIEVSGKVVLDGKDAKTEVSEYKVFGAMRVNLDKGWVKWRVQLVGHVKDKDDDSDALSHTITTDVTIGDEAKAAASQPASLPAGLPFSQPAGGSARPATTRPG